MRQLHASLSAIGRGESGRRNEGGLSLIELLFAMSLLTVGVVALGGVLVATAQQRRMDTARLLVLDQAVRLVEEIKEADTAVIEATYDGTTHSVEGVYGENILTVEVDSTHPTRLVVTVTGDWVVGQMSDSLELRTEILQEE